MLWRGALLSLVRAWRGSLALAGCSGGMLWRSALAGCSGGVLWRDALAGKPARGQQKASKKPARKARGQQEASKKLGRGQQEASKTCSASR